MIAEQNINEINQFFTGDIVEKISRVVGETTEKTTEGLKTIIPEMMNRIISRGTTSEGAASLVNLIERNHYQKDLLLDDQEFNEGNLIVDNLYGTMKEDELNRYALNTRIEKSKLLKLMQMTAPMCIHYFASRLRPDELSLSSLMKYMQMQKKELSGFSPRSSEYYELTGRNPDNDFHNRRAKPVWQSWIWALVIAGLLMVWWDVKLYKSPVELKTPVTTMTVAPIGVFGDFLANPKQEQLPKKFRFDSIAFLGESTRLAAGFSEINYVAEMLKKYPSANVKLIGVGENVGTDKDTIDFAARRAELVKEELVRRGIDSHRISIAGLPNASPAGYKSTTPGNAKFQYMEIEVTKI